MCYSEAQKHYGNDLLARLDDFIVFHRLKEDQLSEILDRLIRSLNRRLQPSGVRCDLTPAAREFLLERGRRNLQMGARELLRMHRRFIEFPVGDLTISGRVPASGRILVDRRPEEKTLHFTVTRAENGAGCTGVSPRRHEVDISWEDSPD